VSNSRAIAAVTATLRGLLQKRLDVAADLDASADAELSGTNVTALPPDEAQQAGPQDGNRLNVFLYKTSLDAALRNAGAQPALPLTLHYLVMPYVREDATLIGQRLLGRAMSILHDHPVLGPAEIKDALDGNDLHLQAERVRIVPETVSTEELSRLWACFQAKFRVSAAYQVSVVLIDSIRPSPAAPPVLSRGEGDRGPAVFTGRAPTLFEARPPDPQRSVRLGEELRLLGEGLDEAGLTVRISGPKLEDPVVLQPLSAATASSISIRFVANEDAMQRWSSGFYSAALVVRRQGSVWTSNEVPFAFAPTIGVDPRDVAAGGELTLSVSPRLRDGQRVVLLIGDRNVAPSSVETSDDPTRPSLASFVVPDIPPGSYLVRLRVDGVDSIPIVRKPGPPPTLAFDDEQIVTVWS
jgi:uncharacterized protein DUF4255